MGKWALFLLHCPLHSSPCLATKMLFLVHTTKKPFSLGLTSSCHFLVKGDANVQIASISEELAKKTEDAARQQEEITHLLSQIVDLQKKAKAVRLLFLWMLQMAFAPEDHALWFYSLGVCAALLGKRLISKFSRIKLVALNWGGHHITTYLLKIIHTLIEFVKKGAAVEFHL